MGFLSAREKDPFWHSRNDHRADHEDPLGWGGVGDSGTGLPRGIAADLATVHRRREFLSRFCGSRPPYASWPASEGLLGREAPKEPAPQSKNASGLVGRLVAGPGGWLEIRRTLAGPPSAPTWCSGRGSASCALEKAAPEGRGVAGLSPSKFSDDCRPGRTRFPGSPFCKFPIFRE